MRERRRLDVPAQPAPPSTTRKLSVATGAPTIHELRDGSTGCCISHVDGQTYLRRTPGSSGLSDRHGECSCMQRPKGTRPVQGMSEALIVRPRVTHRCQVFGGPGHSYAWATTRPTDRNFHRCQPHTSLMSWPVIMPSPYTHHQHLFNI